jgi:hypothetical protein
LTGRPGRGRPFDDAELRAMLIERADRLGPDAEREVLTAVRSELRAPSRTGGLTVLPGPVAGRASRQQAGLATIGLVAVLVVAVLGGRLGSGPAQPTGGTPQASAAGAGTTPGAGTTTVPGPSSSAGVGLAASETTLDGLRAGLADGSLDGSIVIVVGGRLKIQPYPCPSPMPLDCYGLELRGLEGVEVTHAGLMSEPDAAVWIDTVRPPAFRVTGKQLALLGGVTEGADHPLTVPELLAPANAPGAADLAVVSGWLTGPDAAACPDRRLVLPVSTVRCPDDVSWLTDRAPNADGTPQIGDAGTMAEVDPSLGLAGSAPVTGPFLVASAAGDAILAPSFRVVARLDPTHTLVVGSTPLATPDGSPQASPAPLTGRISVERLRSAIATRELDGQLVLLTGTLEQQPIRCPSSATAPCWRLAIAGLEDLAVTWDGPATSDPFGGQAATLAVIPDGDTLRLLGRLRGDPAAPLAPYDWRDRFGVLRTPYDLDALRGWLIVNGIHSCPMLGPGATPCPGPGPQLTDHRPTADGMGTGGLQLPAAVIPGTPGIDPASVVTAGPFLARQGVGSTCARLPEAVQAGCAGGRLVVWQVLARYDLDTVVQVTLP